MHSPTESLAAYARRLRRLAARYASLKLWSTEDRQHQADAVAGALALAEAAEAAAGIEHHAREAV